MTFTTNQVEAAIKKTRTEPEFKRFDEPQEDGSYYGYTGEWKPVEYNQYCWSDLGGSRIEIDGETFEIDEVDHEGGMDQGSSAAVVLKVGDQLFRKSGYYQSHDGYYWDGDFEEVVPVEKTIIVYEAKKND